MAGCVSSQPEANQIVPQRPDLPPDSDLLELRESLLNAEEQRELLQAVESSGFSGKLTDSMDSSHLLAPTVSSSEVSSSAESYSSESLGEQRVSTSEGPMVQQRRTSIGEDDWCLEDSSDIGPSDLDRLPASDRRPQRSSLAALFVSTGSSLSGTMGHLSNLSGALYRSSIGAFPTNADEENEERTPQRQSFSEDPSPVPHTSSSADTGGDPGGIVQPNQQMTTSWFNWALGRRN